MKQKGEKKMNKHNFESVGNILKRMIKKGIIGKSLKKNVKPKQTR